MALSSFTFLADRVKDVYPVTQIPIKTKNICFLFFLFLQDTTLEQIVQQMGVMVGFVSNPKVIRDGQAATCVLRPPSAKELSQKGKPKAAASQPASSGSDATVNNMDATEGSVQQ